MSLDLSGILPKDYNIVKDLERVGDTTYLYGGLNIVYGLDGTGKSYQTVVSLQDVENVVYLDADGSNGKAFSDHCERYNVAYVKNEAILSAGYETMMNNIGTTIRSIAAAHKNKKLVFVVDSLTAIGEGQRINNAEDISTPLYRINNTAEELDCCIILIDHATEIRGDIFSNFKLEGNAGAKRRTSVTVNRYDATKKSKPQNGGTFTCERARGNSGRLRSGNTMVITNNNAVAAIEFVVSKSESKRFTKTEFNKMTKNSRDIWVREYVYEIFNQEVDGRKTMLILKEQ